MLANVSVVDFPWDKMAPYKENAQEFAHKTGKNVIDISVGTPVDSVPASIQKALSNAANTPGYPKTIGSDDLREAIVRWLKNVRNVQNIDVQNVLPTVGSKEAVALLSLMLGVGAGDTVVRPKFAYPTYDIGAIAAGAKTLETDDIADWQGNQAVKVVWVNYPSNPTGQCASREHLREVIKEARKIGAFVASDECYALFDWRENERVNGEFAFAHPSVLENDVCEGSFDNVLMLYSLSKQVNIAGYRAAFIAGDVKLIAKLAQIRKQIGLIPPEPIQRAMITALNDLDATNSQVEKYRKRHAILKQGLIDAGYEVQHSEGSLYVWVKAKSGNCWQDLENLSQQGILVAPGEFYDESAKGYLRFSVTASDDDIVECVRRLT